MNKTEKQDIVEKARKHINLEMDVGKLNDEELRRTIEGMVTAYTAGQFLSITERLEIVTAIYNTYRGLGGLLDSVMTDPSITEIMVNGPKNIFVERGGTLTKIDREFRDEEDLTNTARRIANEAHKEISPASPVCDLVLNDGSRVNIVVPPIALGGTTITIRRFSRDPMTMDKLIEFGSLTPEIAEFLRKLVEARYNIFIAGGTGSGKTTFLNALSNYIPKDQRIITIEDAPELQITNIPNIVRMQTRQASASASKEREVTMQDLIRASLRMRPDRIIVGEVRGPEALDMLQAMNTGHDGSLSTGHANSARDMLSRLETMVLQGSAGLPLPAIDQQIASALDIIIFLSRLRDHTRKTMMITEVLDRSVVDLEELDPEVLRMTSDSSSIILNPLYTFEEDEAASTLSHVAGRLIRTKYRMIGRGKMFSAGFSEADIPEV